MYDVRSVSVASVQPAPAPTPQPLVMYTTSPYVPPPAYGSVVYVQPAPAPAPTAPPPPQPVVFQPAPMPPVAPQRVIVVSKTSREWSSGVCSCMEDCGVCMGGLCCPGIMICRVSDAIGNKESGCGTICGGCIAQFLVIPLCCATCTTRAEVRDRFSIHGGSCGNCMTTICCLQCAVCQVRREIKERTERGEFPNKT